MGAAGDVSNGESTEDKMSLSDLKSVKWLHLEKWVNNKKIEIQSERAPGEFTRQIFVSRLCSCGTPGPISAFQEREPLSDYSPNFVFLIA